MRILNEREYERGGSRFRSYVCVSKTAVWRQEDIWLTLDSRWLHYAERRIGQRAAERYRERAGTGTLRESLELAPGYVERSQPKERRLHTL